MKYGFIGCGNMAQAMISGIIDSQCMEAKDMLVSDRSNSALDAIKNIYNKLNVTQDNEKVASQSDVLVLSVKPQVYPTVINEIKEVISASTIVVTIAPGFSITRLLDLFGKKTMKIIRCMPNTPAMVSEGMTAFAPNENCHTRDVERIKTMLSSFGRCAQVDEAQMNTVTAISGSSPAYVFMFIEAMADAAVHEGMSRNLAYEFAAQAVMGSAKMVLETKKHPAKLKDMVCSPAGTTIEAVRVLEKKGFRSAVIEAVTACADKSRDL